MSAPYRFLLLSLLAVFLPQLSPGEYLPVKAKVPDPKREFRAAWIATVHNIDWPSTYTLSPAQQRAELIGLLDLAAATGLNAVVLQVRTECDAFYKSSIEPWSWFLTGKMGSAPSDGYDPLEFAVQEAHRRGIELHAWFNPFRASATERSPKSSKHISKTHSSLMLSVGSQKWANPSSDYVRNRAIAVMVDVTKRYDVDAVHIDDYFYPYPKTVSGKTYDQFDDSAAFRAYQAKGGKLDVRYWRRSNIDSFVQSMYSSVKSTKPWVQVGVSPFGIWRPGYPSTVKAGLDAYDHIFADSRKWLQNGWLDYFSPQLYWRIYPADQSFTALQSWWTDQNSQRRHLWPGIASSRILSSDDKGRPSTETIKQIEVTRNKPSPMGPGHLHWSIKAIKEDRGGLRSRLGSAYAETAIPPASPWLGSSAPEPVYVAPVMENGGLTLAFKPGAQARWKVIQVKEGRQWITLRRIPASQSSYHLDKEPEEVAVRHVSATGILSVPTVLRRQ
ncbi:MAG: family 10 glycosylhydrolase [Verrucomicrobiales bacterium]|nr:family 10 glycosylhydrolase [Verrucomicrobiales bacterium]